MPGTPITVPEGYDWQVVVRWGDPLWSDAVDFDQASRGTGDSQERAFGDNTDGMALFAHDGHAILAVNNEYTNRSIIYGNRETKLPENEDDVRKARRHTSVTVVEIDQTDGKWNVVKDSPYNRRITADTPMDIDGPARGHDLLKTAADPTGTTTLGTWNNCGNGRTPWGTYLACEENFNGYFRQAMKPTRRLRNEALRRQQQGLGLRLGHGRRAIRYFQASERAQPGRLCCRNRPA